MSSFEKSVKGATKIKLAPPKTKYIEHILVATHAGEAGVGDIFRALNPRLRDATWTVAYKSLITVHLMIREGSPDATLAYLAKHRDPLVLNITDAQTQGRNIRHYAGYLNERARAYRQTKLDWVRGKESRLEKLSVDKGLLRETEVVQAQLTALLKCDVMDNEPENEITITCFRLLVLDLLALFQVLNQAMINILGHFFEMSKTDAERAMAVYRNFTKQTDYVVQYLGTARQYEHHTRVEVPKLKHAPVNLGRQLEEYLRDPDFEIQRRQYLAELEAKKRGGGAKPKTDFQSKASSSKAAFPTVNGSPQVAKASSSQPARKGPDVDLIDFFESIEQNQTTMAVPQHQQAPQIQQATGISPWGTNPFQVQPTGQVAQYPPNGFIAQQTGFAASPFQQQAVTGYGQPQLAPQQIQMQSAYTGAGFGGYAPQQGFQPGALGSIPQDAVASFQPAASPTQQVGQQQSLNPFRASLLAQPTGAQPAFAAQVPAPTGIASPQSPTSTNPFARASPQQQQQPMGISYQAQPPAAVPVPAPLQPTPTGTNPFARNYTGSPANTTAHQQQQQQASPTNGPTQQPQQLAPQPTGSLNPFRQGAFVNHATGLGWHQTGTQPAIGGGLDTINTVPVFPRPAPQTPWQQ